MTDSELVRALQRGGREVFGDLVDRYRDMVHSVCYRIAGNKLDAEELAHEAFVEAYLKIGTLREPEKLGGWLRAIALNLCRMWYRRRKQAWQELPEEIEAAAPEGEDPALLARMSAGLSQLSAGQRLVLVLHYFEGLSYEQMAEFLEVPIGTIMSRLHRARQGLRVVLESTAGDEEIPVVQEERFKEDIQAEIDVLLEMFADQPTAAQRLTVILQHSPERFAQLIGRTENETTLEHLAILLPRLGATAMDAALNAALGRQAEAAGHAGAILRYFVSRCKSLQEPGWEPGTPCRSAYELADRVIVRAADAEAKAELLLDLLDACEDEETAALVTNLLLCYPRTAVGSLIEWLRAVGGPEELYGSAWRLYAVCRTGRRFCETLVEMLQGKDSRGKRAALAGAEALGRCLDLRWLQGATKEMVGHAVRVRAKWPPLRSEDLDAAVVGAMVDRIASLLEDETAEIRNMALGALGRLRAGGHVKSILPYAVDEDASTRLAAIRCLAEIGDASAAGGVLMHVARGPGEAAERRVAIEALGRLKVKEAEGLLVSLLAEGDAQVQEAAMIALGEMDTPAAQEALKRVLTAGDMQLRKRAARVIYGKPRRPALAGSGPAIKTQTQAQRLRGDAQPVTYSSVGEVMRLALPEIRPYEEQDLTRRIAGVCIDYSMTRRRLVDEGWMVRETGTYELAEPGRAAWRVERFITQEYLQ